MKRLTISKESRKAGIFLILFLLSCVPERSSADTTFSRILPLPVQNTPDATYSIPASDAGGTTWRIPFNKFTGGGGGTGDALTSQPLSQFAATTSLQLAGVLTDEHGTGSFILSAGTLNISIGKTLTASQTLTLNGDSGATANFGGGLSITTGKSLAASNTITLAGIDGSTLNIGTGGTISTAGYSGAFSDLTGTGNVVQINQGNVYNPGLKQTFNGNSTTAGIRILPAGSDPSAGVQGDLGFRSDIDRPRMRTSTGWKTFASTEDAAGASLQTVTDMDIAWTNGKTTMQRTAALTAVRAVTMPAASSFPPGFTIRYYDNASSSTSSFAPSFFPAGGDTINGATDPVPGSQGRGFNDFVTDGVSAWNALVQDYSILGLQDPGDRTKKAHFVFASGFPTMTDREINVAASNNSTTVVPLPAPTGQFVNGVDGDGNLLFATPAGGSGVTSIGNLSPLFNATVVGTAATFAQQTAGARTFFSNTTGSTAAPGFSTVTQTVTALGVNFALSPTAVRTANYSAAINEFVPVDTTSSNITVNLPSAPPDLTRVGVKMVAVASSHTVTINSGGSDVFNKTGGVTSQTLSGLNQTLIVQYRASGAIWYVIGKTDDPASGVVFPLQIIRTNTTGSVATGRIKGYYTFPVTGTIVGWSITVDAGTATLQTWKIADGTAKPTVANSISTSGVAISSGTHIKSSTLSDFTTTAVTAGDIFAFNVGAVSGVTDLTFDLYIQP